VSVEYYDEDDRGDNPLAICVEDHGPSMVYLSIGTREQHGLCECEATLSLKPGSVAAMVAHLQAWLIRNAKEAKTDV
jgi:hypothetical protein